MDHQVRVAQKPVVEDRARQSIGWVAPQILSRGQHHATLFGRCDHRRAGANGDAQRLFAQDMLAGLQRRHCHLVVDRGISGHVHRRNVGVRHGLVQIGEDQGRATEEALYFPPAQIRVLGVEVAHGHQFDIADAAVLQFFVGEDMAMAHTAAADQAKWNLFQCLLLV